MTVAVALVDPPREGVVMRDVVDRTPLTPADGVALYEAMLADFFEVIPETNVDLLVNVPTEDQLPGDGSGSPEAEIRTIAARTLDPGDLDDIRFEVQVGSTPSARIGNAITHLLRDEEETSAAFVEHRVPLLNRSVIDQASIALRRNDTVVGPAADGQVYLAGFTEPIDFEDVLADTPVEAIVSRSVDADHPVDFLRRRDVVRTARDLRTVVSLVRARRQAGKPVPTHTAATIDELGLRVDDGSLVVDHGSDR